MDCLDELGGVFLGGAADFADHDDRLGVGVGQEHLQHVDELGALDRIAADADGGGLAEAHVGGLEHRFIGEGAGARDHADACRGCEDVARHDADLALVGREDARAVRPDQARLGAGERALHLDHVEHRDALGDADDQQASRRRWLPGWRRRRRAAARRCTVASAPVVLDGFVDGVEHRQADDGSGRLCRA